MSFFDAIKPLIKLCHILGLAPYSRIANTSNWTRNRLHETVTFGYFIVVIAIFGIYLIFNGAIIDYTDPGLIVAICIYSFVIVCAQTFVVLCETFYKRYQHIKLLNIFEELESIFKRNHSLPLDNLRLKRILRLAILFWMLQTLGLLSLNIALWLESKALDELFFFLTYTLPHLISKLSFIFWIILVVILQDNVNALIKYTESFNTKVDGINHDTKSFELFDRKYRQGYAARNTQNLMEHLKKCYILIWEASMLINAIVLWSFPIEFLNELSVLVFNCFFTIKISQLPEFRFMQLFHIALWDAMNLINVIFVNTICGNTVEAVELLKQTIPKIPINVSDKRSKIMMVHLMLQTHHQRIAFTLRGFLNIDNALTFSLVGSMTTYLVILIQFSQ